MNKLSIALAAAGLVSLVAGAYLVHPALALAVLGLGLIAAGILNLNVSEE